MKKKSLTFLVLVAALLFPMPLLADWTACLAPYPPDLFFAADKAGGLLFQIENNHQPAITREFPCIHGQVEGDKQKEGDLKTPEGIYFITHKVTQKLDFMEYGPHAFALNYPNPVDRIRKKTGSGIWLHSKGQPIAGIQTRGCLAIEQDDICNLLSVLAPGTPVLIAEHLGDVSRLRSEASLPQTRQLLPDSSPSDISRTDLLRSGVELPTTVTTLFSNMSSREVCPPVSGECSPAENSARTSDAEEIRFLTGLWIQYWQQCQETLFSLYDKQRFPQGNREKLAHMRTRLKRDFRKDERIAYTEDIQILEGPGYWVSCFSSSARLGKSWVNGQRILYWMPGDNGAFLIVGDLLIRR